MLPPELDARADRATCFSMLLAIAFVVVALWMKVRWSTCLWMVLGGVGIYGASELICLGILKSILKGRQWAIDLVVWILWPKSYARAIVEPQPASPRLLLWHLQTFLSPDALYPLVVDTPAGNVKQPSDPPVAVASKLACQLDDHCRQHVFILSALRDMSLYRSMLVEHPARPPF